MRIMEGNRRSGTHLEAVDSGCVDVRRNRSSTEAVESCEVVMHCQAMDNNSIWTDEKHSSYIEHLEVSFVKQLHQSMGFLARCTEKNKRGKFESQRQPINSDITSMKFTIGQYGGWKKINNRSDILSGVSTDSCDSVMASGEYSFKSTRVHGPVTSAEGVGQNFVDNDHQNKSNSKARVKRVKTDITAHSSHD